MTDRGWQVVRVVAWLSVPLLVGVFVVATIVGPLRPVRQATTYPLMWPALGLLDVAAGTTLAGAGALAWLSRRHGVGLLAMLAGTCWFGPDWAGGLAIAPVARMTGMAASALVLPLVVLLVVRAERVRMGQVGRTLLLGMPVLVAGIGAAWMLSYEARLDPRCLELCGLEPIGAGHDFRRARLLLQVLSGIEIAAGLGLAAWSAGRLARASAVGRRGSGPMLGPAIAVGLAWAGWAMAMLPASTVTPATGDVMVGLFVVRAGSLLALGVGLAWVLIRARRTLTAVQRIAWRLSPLPGGGSLRASLATATGYPDLALYFPLPGTGLLVDPDGHEVPARASVAGVSIEHAGEMVAIAVMPGAFGPDLGRDLGDTVRLAAANERLLAAVRHEVLELRASRARIVQTGDAARYQLERDLHDGAQQRILALLSELVLAQEAAQAIGDVASAACLRQAVADTDAAIDALRRIARGIHPGLLTEAGLVAALEQVAIEAPIPVELDAPAEVDCGYAAAAIAWRVVADTIGQAAAGADEVRLRVTTEGGRLRIEVVVEGARGSLDLVPLEDRAGAGGGTITPGIDADGARSFIVSLPCA